MNLFVTHCSAEGAIKAGRRLVLRSEELLSKTILAIVICFATIFILSQSLSLLEAIQVSQVQPESFKVENEVSRKELVPLQLEAFLSTLLAHIVSEYSHTVFTTVAIEISLFIPQFSDILLCAKSSPRAPPYLAH